MKDYSQKDLLLLAQRNPALSIAIHLTALGGEPPSKDGYDEFNGLVDDALDFCIREMERQPQLHYDQNEDRLSKSLISPMLGMGFEVDSKANGGNVDVAIELGRSYSWLGESKIWDGPAYIFEGYLQLTTRYASGGEYQTSVGMITFCGLKRSDQAMLDWANHLSANGKDVSIPNMPIIGSTGFRSTYRSERSGAVMSVRHMSVSIYFKPEDKSGRARVSKSK
jgi:hypothetical protein